MERMERPNSCIDVTKKPILFSRLHHLIELNGKLDQFQVTDIIIGHASYSSQNEESGKEQIFWI